MFELEPAYGRDYTSKRAVVAAFKNGFDFMGDYQMGFKPCGIADFKPGDVVNLRFARKTKVAVLTIGKDTVCH